MSVDNAFKRLQLDEYKKQYFNKEIRADGRKYQEFRDILINIDSIKTCDSSSIVKLGNTSIICGIKIYENPDLNELDEVTYKDMIDLKLNLNCLEEESDNGTLNLLERIIKNDPLFDSSCLIESLPNVRIYFSMLIEFIGLNNDGNLLDACLIGLMTSLNTCPLPSTSSTCDQGFCKDKTIKLLRYPISITLLLIDSNTIFIDPTLEESSFGSGFLTFIFDANSDKILLIDKKGCIHLSESCLFKQLSICKPKASKFLQLIKLLKQEDSIKFQKL